MHVIQVKLLQLPAKVRSVFTIMYLTHGVYIILVNHNFLSIAHTIVFARCTTGEVSFTNFTDDDNEYWRQGILQICINNAWGTVCSDNFFDNTDAEVFCKQLKGFNSTGKVHSIIIYCIIH